MQRVSAITTRTFRLAGPVRLPRSTSAHHRRPLFVARAEPSTNQDSRDNDDEEDLLLLEEEDFTVPGGVSDSLSPNTPLGKAVRAACDELEHLNKMELGTLQEAQGLLAKLGYKGSIFAVPEGSAPSAQLDKDSLELEGLSGEDPTEA